MAMDGEGQDLVTLTPEEDAEADAAFASGYDATLADNGGASGTVLENDAGGKPLVTEPGDGDTEDDPAAQAAAAEAARVAAEAEARAAAEAEANAPATLSKSELEALRAAAALVPQLQQELVKTRDTTAGKIGSLKQTLDAVQAAASKGQPPTARQLTRLKAEFPELAELLQADLADPGETVDAPGAGGASGDAPGAAPNQVDPPPAPVDPLSDPRVQARLREQSQMVVDAVHPDWKDLAKSPEFKEWRTNLPPAAQNLLASSWDAKVLVPALKDFKTWRDKRAEQAQAQADASKQRNKRLEHSAPATSGRAGGTNAVDEDSAFAAGFSSVRR